MMRQLKLFLAVIAVAMVPLISVNAWALDAASVPAKKQTTAKLYLGAEEVTDFMASKKDKAIFIDVRSRAELMFVGNTPAMTANIPYKLYSTKKFNDKKGKFVLEANPNFVAQVEKLVKAKSLTKDDPVILMCRSGGRSAKAANALTKAGFKKVYSVVDGFEGDKAKEGPNKGQRVVNGWKNKKQPWGYKLEKSKLMLQ
ncbi:MAG: rhodanese-like domain-containing protein [Alphaproteobacteria bacterium]